MKKTHLYLIIGIIAIVIIGAMANSFSNSKDLQGWWVLDWILGTETSTTTTPAEEPEPDTSTPRDPQDDDAPGKDDNY